MKIKNKEEKIIKEALTFDDVLLVPAYSEVSPSSTDVSTQLTRNIRINIPVISSAMDTVTESESAIVMAQQGGIGILHKNMSKERQAEEVNKVKRSESVLIKDPVILPQTALLEDAVRIINDQKIGGIPVVTNGRKLVGIITNRDIRFQKNLKVPISEVMTKDLIIAKAGINMKEAEELLLKHKIEKLPVLNGEKELIGLITYKDILKVKDHPFACKDEYGRLKVGAAIGPLDEMERYNMLVEAGVDLIVLDTAHGHSKAVIETIINLKKLTPNIQIIAGNIATGKAGLDLAKAGADAVKVGIGPGSICTTRVISGVGIPQLTAIMDVASALQGSGIPVIADGGIRFSGDIVKAIAAGANSVMVGSLFAGVDESPGETIIYEGRKFKIYRGMGSIEAMKEGSKDRYFQGEVTDNGKLVPEGIVGRVPYKGNLKEMLFQLVGGLKAGMGYCGAKNIKELQNAKFVKITHAGVIENHPHDVTIMKESPNYSR